MDESFVKRFDLWRALAFRKNAQVARFSSYTDVMLQYFLKYMAVILKIRYHYQQPLRMREMALSKAPQAFAQAVLQHECFSGSRISGETNREDHKVKPEKYGVKS